MEPSENREAEPGISRVEPQSGISTEEIQNQLERILSSRTFRSARGQSKFLAYAVRQSIAGRFELIKECWIGRDALGRGDSFDPRLDPIVRTQARKLRLRLTKYYHSEGQHDPIWIRFQKGSYIPLFERLQGAADNEPIVELDTKLPADLLTKAEGVAASSHCSPPAPLIKKRPFFHIQLAIAACIVAVVIVVVAYRWMFN